MTKTWAKWEKVIRIIRETVKIEVEKCVKVYMSKQDIDKEIQEEQEQFSSARKASNGREERK